MPSQAKTKGRKRKTPVDGSYASQHDQANNPSSEQIQYLEPPTCNLLSLPFELYSLVVSHLKVEKVRGIFKGNGSRAQS